MNEMMCAIYRWIFIRVKTLLAFDGVGLSLCGCVNECVIKVIGIFFNLVFICSFYTITPS
jgi:hypothetical protein